MKKLLSTILLILSFSAYSQNEFTKWYFGKNTGLDFMTNPPSVITHTTLFTWEGSSSVADGAGNLLFYTDGSTIWNSQQLVMANGTGLFGNGSTVQAALIAKQPGNANIYYVFTLDLQGGSNGLCYSLVDMNLAAGMGSVTVKNATVATPCTEQLTGVRHCNGVDLWVLTHDFNSNTFKSFLLTASGLNASPVLSAIGPAPPSFTPNGTVGGQGTIKISPSGKKLGMTFFNGSNNSEVALFDFNRNTGTVSNYLSLILTDDNYYGCEFSGDGTKFYTTPSYGASSLYQWDLCAGSNAQILASQTVISSTMPPAGQLQLAPNGKIYIVNYGSQTLAAINNPNLQGIACNYSPMALSVASGTNGAGLPNFIAGVNKNLPSFNYSVNPMISCASATFAAPTITTGCAASSYSVQSISWDFGQPLTGPANTSTLNSPIHNFGSPGIYPVKLIYHYACGADTIYKNVSITGPTLSVNHSPVTCASSANATLNIAGAAGPFTYNWMPSSQTNSVATVNPGIYTVTVYDSGTQCTYTYNALVNPSTPFSGTVSSSSICFGASSGSANINLTQGTGGSGIYSYNWSNGQTASGASSLTAGIYTVSVTDLNCVLTKTFQISSQPSIGLSISVPTIPLCPGTPFTLQATAFGGTGSLSYSWTNGPATSSFVSTQTVGGTFSYSLTVTDLNGCTKTGIVQLPYYLTPTVSVQSASVCPKGMATITASGSTTYTWLPGNTNGPSLTAAPNSTQIYTVTTTFSNGCTSTTTGTITVLKCTDLKESSTTKAELTIFPNPVSTELFISAVEPVEISIYDFSGKVILTKKLEKGLSTLDVMSWLKGPYLLKAKGKTEYPVYKIIKLE